MSTVRLSDLLDLSAIQKMADAIYRAAGTPIGIIDAIDGSILVGAGWQDICVKFHRANPESLIRCQTSDAYIKDHLVQGQACPYKCANGLWDIGIPIVVSGQHLATLFLGQFFYEGEVPERGFFVRQAEAFGYDVADYLAALDRVSVLKTEKVDDVLEYNKGLADFLTDLAEQALSVREAQSALREKEEKFSLIFSANPDAVWISRLSDGQQVDINAGFTQLTGFDREEALGRTAEQLGLFDDRENWQRLIETVTATGLCENVETRIRRKDGTQVTGLTSTSILSLGGEPHILFISRDISELKRIDQERETLQERLMQAQKLEAIGRLAGGVAHDFNNMLGVIVGHTDLALEQMDPLDPLHRNMQEIRTAAERSVTLTRQLLGFARKQTISPHILDLNETVESMLSMLRRLIGEEIQLIWKPGDALWPVKMDPGQIDQVLANLLLNARDAIAGIGSVTIETTNRIVDETSRRDSTVKLPGDFVALSVSDSGRGISKDALDRIFEPFFTTKPAGRGTGLGLATVYGIVKQNDGFIDVYSDADRGTIFCLYLPRSVGAMAEPQDRAPMLPSRPGRETILLVEDEPAILKITQLMLETSGYHVLSAGTPGEAIRVAQEHAGDVRLLMTDVVMPEMNGRELSRRLLSLYPHMACLFVSGYTADVIAHRGVLDKGMNFIQKPFTKNELAAKIRQVLDS